MSCCEKAHFLERGHSVLVGGNTFEQSYCLLNKLQNKSMEKFLVRIQTQKNLARTLQVFRFWKFCEYFWQLTQTKNQVIRFLQEFRSTEMIFIVMWYYFMLFWRVF